VADLDDVEEIKADGPARKGRRAVVGLATTASGLVAGGKTVNEFKQPYLAGPMRPPILWMRA